MGEKWGQILSRGFASLFWIYNSIFSLNIYNETKSKTEKTEEE